MSSENEKSSEKWIYLGYPLDVLLNRKCKLIDYKKRINNDFNKNQNDEKSVGEWGSLILPDTEKPGSGNIIIKGKYGSGKSTLALQIAVSATQKPNDFYSIYISLEEPVEHIISKADTFGWQNFIHPVRILYDLNEYPSQDELGQYLKHVLTQPPTCGIKTTKGAQHEKHADAISNKVIFASLSPRNMLKNGDNTDKLFWDRFNQIESLLTASRWLEMNEKKTLGIVCIDCLNVFGNKPLERDELFRLFDLFKRYKILGLFTVEDTDQNGYQQKTIDYLADVVISLQMTEDKGYFLRYFEIEKSRYHHQVYGKHPFKLKSLGSSKSQVATFSPIFNIFPSLHFLVSATDAQQKGIEEDKTTVDTNDNDPCARDGNFDIGIKELSGFLPQDLKRGSVVTIEGPAGTYKTGIAENFLIKGLTNGENCLFIHLSDRNSFTKNRRLNKCFFNKETSSVLKTSGEKNDDTEIECIFNWDDLKYPSESTESGMKQTVKKQVWEYAYTSGKNAKLVETAFPSGNITPEEFCITILSIIEEFDVAPESKIRRIVLDDVSLIGVSYPFLQSNKTSIDLFLTAFVHLVRNYHIDLIMTGTTGHLTEANNMVNKACSLADAMISCRYCNIFGKSMVLVTGEGIKVGGLRPKEDKTPNQGSDDDGGYEIVPGVIRLDEEKELYDSLTYQGDKNESEKYKIPFVIDREYLKGLVGIEDGNIHRPGLTLRINHMANIHQEYNDQIKKLLEFSFAGNENIFDDKKQRTDVSIELFGSALSEAVNESLGVLEGAPINRTVVCALDEFWGSQSQKQENREGYGFKNRQFTNALIDLSKLIKIDENKEKFIVSLPPNKILAWPYYGNVLLFAYRKDVFKKDEIDVHIKKFMNETERSKGRFRFKDWENVLDFAQLIYSKKEAASPDSPRIEYLFDYETLSYETMSCILLDTLISGLNIDLTDAPELPEKDTNGKKQASPPDLFDVDCERGKSVLKGLQNEKSYPHSPLFNQINSLRNLFINPQNNQEIMPITKELKNPDEENRIQNKEEKERAREKREKLSGNAAVYLCWYTQLRELLLRYPKLSETIDVCALPGRGVTGDWFLGIIKGSVSINLGLKVIDLLCEKSEEYKRFAQGIGLPVRTEYYGNNPQKSIYYAWPRSNNVSLNNIFKIHRQAILRSSIPDYKYIRHILSVLFKQIITDLPTDEEKIKDIITRLPEQIKNLSQR